jgi:hypothetical protein
MSRIKTVLLAGALVLVPAGVAVAAKVTGGSAQVTASSAAARVLSSNGISAKALAPATQSGTTFTFPVTGGRLNATTKHGSVRTAGGLALSTATTTVRARHLTVVSDKHGVFVWALVVDRRHSCRLVGHRHPHPACHTVVRTRLARIATVSNVTITGTSAGGTLHITAATATLVNRLAGKAVVQAGDVLGTGKISPAFG